jgi:hypothetical protein
VEIKGGECYESDLLYFGEDKFGKLDPTRPDQGYLLFVAVEPSRATLYE